MEIKEGVTEIKDNAFLTTSISQLKVPEGATRFGDLAVANCVSLTKVSLPATLKEIGRQALASGRSLQEVTIAAETPPTQPSNEIFGTSAYKGIVYVPKGRVEAYKSHPSWQEVSNRIYEMGAVNHQLYFDKQEFGGTWALYYYDGDGKTPVAYEEGKETTWSLVEGEEGALRLDNFVFSTSARVGLEMRDGGTLYLNGNNEISSMFVMESNEAKAISASQTLTIKGDGQLTATASGPSVSANQLVMESGTLIADCNNDDSLIRTGLNLISRDKPLTMNGGKLQCGIGRYFGKRKYGLCGR